MTTSTNAGPESDGGKGKSRSTLLIAILILLLIGFAAWYFLLRDTQTEIGADGEFRTSFEGCDDAGNCATFTIYAPGRAYAWEYRRTVPVDVPEAQDAFGAKIATDLREAEGILVAGTASQEGDRTFNERLATCRARAFEGIMVDTRDDAGSSAPIYRVALGQYRADAPAAASAGGAPGAGTQIQRVMVLAFVKDIPEEIDLAQALRNGANEFLTAALEQLENEDGAVAEQLQFQRYSCWNSLEATALGGYARACYPENPSLIDTLCSTFN